jgi:hypothetical protein
MFKILALQTPTCSHTSPLFDVSSAKPIDGAVVSKILDKRLALFEAFQSAGIDTAYSINQRGFQDLQGVVSFAISIEFKAANESHNPVEDAIKALSIVKLVLADVLGDLVVSVVGQFIDISMGVDKGSALSGFCDKHGYTKHKDVVAVGDSGHKGGNDESLLRGVLMSAHVGVKPPADSGTVLHVPRFTDGTFTFLKDLNLSELPFKILAADNDSTLSNPTLNDRCSLHDEIRNWLFDSFFPSKHPITEKPRRLIILTGRGGDVIAGDMLGNFLQEVIYKEHAERVHIFPFNGACEIHWHSDGKLNSLVWENYFLDKHPFNGKKVPEKVTEQM